MINHYNAFISYKHAPEDNVVAEAVHKGLERFHIPGKLRKKTGMKKINRIFRDTAELPITSDLGDTIEHALANSDYLIVICSTNTKQSTWVPREIEFFLKNHRKRDIFTVLVNGEPFDVIPDILKYDDHVVTDENGVEHTVQIPIEPLSCDYRMPPRKARRTELPRLASGIIGCAYDELMNRHRQYRLKQLTAGFSTAFAVLLGFSGYMLYSRNRIHQTYLESLRNQSRYLANESVNLFEKEQRLTSLQLALEALPKNETDDRPVTPEAVKALTDATLAYRGSSANTVAAAWNYQMPNKISYFEVNDTGETIAILDYSGVVRVWDTRTHTRILSFNDLNGEIMDLKFLSDNSLAVWSDRKMVCYDVTTGDMLWEYVPEHTHFYGKENMMLSDHSFYILTTNDTYLKIDSASGKQLAEITVPQDKEEEKFYISESRLSPDGTRIAIRGFFGLDQEAYGILDPGSENITISEPVENYVNHIEWAGNDAVMVSIASKDASGSSSLADTETISIDHTELHCLNASDCSERWAEEFVSNGVAQNSGFVVLDQTAVAYFTGNIISVYDMATGKLQYSSNVNDTVIDVSDRDGKPVYITANGGFAVPALEIDQETVYCKHYFVSDLKQAAIRKGVYVCQLGGTEVIYYGTDEYDDAWTPFGDEFVLAGTVKEHCFRDGILAVLSSSDDTAALTLFHDHEKPVQLVLPDENPFRYKLLGIHSGQVYLGCQHDGDYELLVYDQNGNELQNHSRFQMASIFSNACVMTDGRLVYFVRKDNLDFLGIHDLDTDTVTETELPEETFCISHTPAYYEEEQIVYLTGDTEYILDTETGAAAPVHVPEDWSGASCFSDQSLNGRFAVSDGKTILLEDKTGSIAATINCAGLQPIGMTFMNDRLLVLYQDGSLCWYAAADGQFVKQTDSHVSPIFMGDVLFERDTQHNLLLIQMDRLTDMIDLESGIELAYITNSFGYDRDRDLFVTLGDNDNDTYKVGYYRRYSVADLIQKAHGILGDTELSDEMKSRYGIK